jgi:hypothetical protein
LNDALVFTTVAVCVIAAWFGVLFVISRIGPWHSLATKFPHRILEEPQTRWFNTLRFGLSSYSNCIISRCTDSHLTLQPLHPFRPFHPPFTVSQDDVTLLRASRAFFFMPAANIVIDGKQMALYGPVVRSAFITGLADKSDPGQ